MTGNFTPDYLKTGNYLMGYFDQWNVGTNEITGNNSGVLSTIENSRNAFAKTSDGDYAVYDLLFRPPVSILNSVKPLVPKTDMVISFDRAVSDLAMISKTANGENPLENQVLKLENVFLRANYYSSPYLRNYFASIEDKEISYRFDETQVICKNIPQGMKTIRFPNIIGGNTPSYLFAGIIESAAIMGNNKLSSTGFKQNKVLELDITLDGVSVTGFPIKTDDGIPVLAFDSYLKATHRAFNNSVSETIPIADYNNFHFLYGHRFSGDISQSGWIGCNLKLSNEYETNYCLGIQKPINENNLFCLVLWTVHECEVKIDRYRRIEKLIH